MQQMKSRYFLNTYRLPSRNSKHILESVSSSTRRAARLKAASSLLHREPCSPGGRSHRAGYRHSGRGSTHRPPLTSPFTRWLRLSPFPVQNFIEFPPSEQRKVGARDCGGLCRASRAARTQLRFSLRGLLSEALEAIKSIPKKSLLPLGSAEQGRVQAAGSSSQA